PSPDMETRLILDRSGKRLVVFAEEMYSTATAHLLDDIGHLYAPEEKADYRFLNVLTAGKLSGVLTIPVKHDSTQEAILISSIILQTSDSTLIQIGAYVNQAAFQDLKVYLDLAQHMFSSIQPGTRTYPYHARTAKLALIGNLHNLVFPCPDRFIVTSSLGFDFNTYQIRALEPITRKVSGGIVVYTGNHPSFFAPEYKFGSEQRKEKEGMFLQSKVVWSSYSDPKRKLWLDELVVDAPAPSTGVKIHIVLISSSEKERSALLKIAETFSIKKLGE
ncbi:MAG TPA: hypothetical protein VNZ86_07705, partial [Bacteroidia bacterium]|nr:hypothetical protein [Bacteroidia bacterium]